MENKNFSPAVSIIIPMYNVEKYIAECLDSILAQTFKNFEVILVDNGSTDKSHAIAESYIPKFAENIQGGGLGYKIITLEENSGNAAKPRNVGIKIARGEYLYFVDSDDVISPTTLEELYPIAKENDVDTLYIPRRYSLRGETFKTAKINMLGKPRKIEWIKDPIAVLAKSGFAGAPWKYFYKREFITQNEIEFPDLMPGEDRMFAFFVHFFAKKFLYVPNIVYYHRLLPSSVTHSHAKEDLKFFKFWTTSGIKSLKIAENFMNKFDYFKEHPEVKYGAIRELYGAQVGFLANKNSNEKISMQERESIIQEAVSILEDKTTFITFLVNWSNDMLAAHLKKDAELKKLNEQMQPLKEDNKKFQTENQELKLKVQSTSEITSKILEKIEDKTQLAPFLFNQAIDLKEEALKKDIELKKLREENKKLLEENKKIQEQLAATSKKLQDEIKKLQSAAS